MSARPTLLSIDWDFFLWRAFEAADGGRLEGLFDWTHNERHGAEMSALLWASRWAAIASRGLDPVALAGFKGPRPAEFAARLAGRADASVATLLLADSHKSGVVAASMARDAAGGCPSVLHFDAHHDCGYDLAEVRRQSRRGEADCASWLYHAARLKVVGDLTVVYPDWRADEEMPVRYPGRVRRLRWSEWLAEGGAERVRVDVAVLARSGAWSPPWYDAHYLELASALRPARTVCLDCAGAEGCGGGFDACRARPWTPPEGLTDAYRAAAGAGDGARAPLADRILGGDPSLPLAGGDL